MTPAPPRSRGGRARRELPGTGAGCGPRRRRGERRWGGAMGGGGVRRRKRSREGAEAGVCLALFPRCFPPRLLFPASRSRPRLAFLSADAA
uniref:Uncharacterized protein n=1 Tax=Arundo donax TaxID=35708 RepID=A0A0A8YSI8_ARUDO